MDDIAVRLARPADLPDLAELRWQWTAEAGGEPVVTRDGFVRAFVAWAEEHRSSHRCVVMLRGERIIGMAWLAITARVPHPGAPARSSGDVQSVYVVPDERDGGLGGRLVEAVVGLARDLGLERVTVHSSDRAVSAYARRGFSVSPRLLQTEITP